jgi:glycosyltransferase involved in cell wall biosynthesis
MKESAGKILIIVQNLPVPFDRRVWLEAQTLRDQGYKISVICPKSREFRESHTVIDRIAIYRYRVPLEAHGFLGYVFEFIYAWLATAILSVKVLFREGFDVIHACNPPDTYFLLGLIYKLFGKTFLFDHHDLSPEMFSAKYEKANKLLYKGLVFLEKLTMRTAKVVLATNESHKEIAMKRGKKPAEDIFIVRSGPDLRRLKIKPEEKALKAGRKYLVCYLGEMCPQDGVDYLLISAKYLSENLGRQDVQFVIMGGGPEMPKLKALSEKMGLAKFVHFTGRIPDEEVCRYLSTADLCVDPDPWSEWANKSTMNKIMEYMAFGKAIVAFDLKESRNSAQQAAVFAKPDDVIDFSLKIHQLLDDPERRASMGRFGLQRVKNELAWDHTHKALLAAYQRVFRAILAERKHHRAENKAPAIIKKQMIKKFCTISSNLATRTTLPFRSEEDSVAINWSSEALKVSETFEVYKQA